MTMWLRGIYCTVLGMIFSGCTNLFFNPNLDLSLASLDSIKVIPDVSSIVFEWNRINDANVAGFVVYRKEGDGDFKRIAVIENSLATHFYDKGLKPETIYAYQFAVWGKNNTISQRSKTLKVKTSFIDPLEALYATSDEPRLVKLIWNPHPNPSIQKYIVEKKQGQKWVEIGEVKNRLGLEYYDRDLLDGTTYEYRVAGVSFEGDRSRYSKVAQATTKFPPPPLVGVQASQDIPKRIVLKWEDSKIKDLAGYIIYGAREEKGKFRKIDEVLKPYYEFKTEENGMVWYFKIVAIDKDGIQGTLNQVPIKGMSLSPLPAPIIQGASVQDGEAVIGWESGGSKVSEIVVYRKEGIFGTPLKFKLAAGAKKFVDKEMQVGVEYTYWVEFLDVNRIPSLPSKEFRLKKN